MRASKARARGGDIELQAVANSNSSLQEPLLSSSEGKDDETQGGGENTLVRSRHITPGEANDMVQALQASRNNDYNEIQRQHQQNSWVGKKPQEEHWLESLKHTVEPIMQARKAVSWRSIVIFMLLYPFLLFLIGMILDQVLHGRPLFFHSRILPLIGFIVGPFLIVFTNWPRHKSYSKIASTSRVVWDIVLSLLCLIGMIVHAKDLATSDPESAFLYEAIANMLDGYQDVHNRESFWAYVKGPLAQNIFVDEDICSLARSQFQWSKPGFAVDNNNFGDIFVPEWCFQTNATYPLDDNNTNVKIGYDIPFSDVKMPCATTLVGQNPDLVTTFSNMQVRQVRVQPQYTVFGGAATITYPPFRASSMETGLYGYGLKLSKETGYETGSEYIPAALEALNQGLRSRYIYCNGSMPLDFECPLLNRTWSELTADQAWYYENGDYRNIAGDTVSGYDTLGPSRVFSYPTGGYSWGIPATNRGFSRDKMLKAADILKSNEWIDAGTRFVQIIVVVSLPNIEKWGIATLNFEFYASGGVRSNFLSAFGQLNGVIEMQQNIDTWPVMFVGLYFSVLTFTVYYAAVLVIRWRERGSIINVLAVDLFVADIIAQFFVFLGWLFLLQSVYQWPGTSNFDTGMIGGREHNLATGENWQLSRDMIGIAILVQWLRMLEYLTLVPRVGHVPRAMIKGLNTILYFLIAMFIVMIGFVSGFVTIYSATNKSFETGIGTTLTLWSALLGNVDVDDFISSRYYMGIFLFVFFSFLLLFVFLTMLISVITEAYEETKAEVEDCKNVVEAQLNSEMHSLKKSWREMQIYFSYFVRVGDKKQE